MGETVREDVDEIYQTQDVFSWRKSVSTVMNLEFLYEGRASVFLTN